MFNLETSSQFAPSLATTEFHLHANNCTSYGWFRDPTCQVLHCSSPGAIHFSEHSLIVYIVFLDHASSQIDILLLISIKSLTNSNSAL